MEYRYDGDKSIDYKQINENVWGPSKKMFHPESAVNIREYNRVNTLPLLHHLLSSVSVSMDPLQIKWRVVLWKGMGIHLCYTLHQWISPYPTSHSLKEKKFITGCASAVQWSLATTYSQGVGKKYIVIIISCIWTEIFPLYKIETWKNVSNSRYVVNRVRVGLYIVTQLELYCTAVLWCHKLLMIWIQIADF